LAKAVNSWHLLRNVCGGASPYAQWKGGAGIGQSSPEQGFAIALDDFHVSYDDPGLILSGAGKTGISNE
jgi:hypothetical protein